MYRQFFWLFFLVVICFYLPAPLQAKTYWLDPAANNTYRLCTANLPCNSITYLVKHLNPGDKVILKEGQYPPMIIADIQGTKNKPIAIKAAGKGVVFKPDELFNSRDLVEFRHVQHVVFSGARFSQAKRAAIRLNNTTDVQLVDNHIVSSGVWGVLTNHSNNIAMVNNTIIGASSQHGIYISNSGDNVLIKNNTIENSLGSGIHINGDLSMGGGKFTEGDGIISNVYIANNAIANVGIKGGAAINIDGGENVEIINNILWALNAAAITVFKGDGAIPSKNIAIKNNLIYLKENSRSALIIKNSNGPVYFSQNIVLSKNNVRGAFEITTQANQFAALFDSATSAFNNKNRALPIISEQNLFALKGDFASVDAKRVLTLNEWKKAPYELDFTSVSLNFEELLPSARQIYQSKATEQLAGFFQKIVANKNSND